ncbi:MAG: translation elongation factor Ts [Chloroflexi bacterium]|nr:translation elongation factor Ts [Chloroflexota bacterium]MDA0245447.1 translation elongation factor Ts [Chloroflexota bacterium]
MAITATMVKELREATGAGILEVKKALEAADGNFDKAADILREKGAARAAKRADRQANEGVIQMYSHPGGRVGVMVEINCETDFVARNEQFQQLAFEIALQIAALSPKYVAREEVDAAELERELDVLRAQAKAEGKPDNIVEKIVEGRIAKFYEEFCLMEQGFIKDDKRKVKDVIAGVISTTGENIVVRRFARYELGEAL